MAGLGSRRNVLLLAVLMGLVTGILVYVYLQPPAAPPTAASASVVIAAREIPAGTVIDRSMIATQPAPADEAADGYCRKPEEVLGKVPTTTLAAGCRLRPEDVVDVMSWGIAAALKPGERAATVAVDSVSGVAGFLKPGDRVDVVATFGSSDQAMSKTVIQNVRLLAIGRVTDRRPRASTDGVTQVASDKTTATIVVSPAQARLLALADNAGRLRLVLRPIGDSAIDVAGPARLAPPRVNVSQTATRPPQPQPGPSPVISGPLPPAAAAPSDLKPVMVISGADIKEILVPKVAKPAPERTF